MLGIIIKKADKLKNTLRVCLAEGKLLNKAIKLLIL